MKVFLGGTCESNWRDKLIPGLNINYYNPLVDIWNDKHKDRELQCRVECDILCYVITPKMKGPYSIAEVIDDSNKVPEKTVFMILPMDEGEYFDKMTYNSLLMVGKMVEGNGGTWVHSGKLQDLCDTLNHFTNL